MHKAAHEKKPLDMNAKKHCSNLFEGLRLVACSSVMLAVCGIKWTAGTIGEFRRKKRKETVVDAACSAVRRR